MNLFLGRLVLLSILFCFLVSGMGAIVVILFILAGLLGLVLS